MLRCSAENSPQTGAVLMGCSDIDVEDFRVTRTLADGLHFNACRRAHGIPDLMHAGKILLESGPVARSRPDTLGLKDDA